MLPSILAKQLEKGIGDNIELHFRFSFKDEPPTKVVTPFQSNM